MSRKNLAGLVAAAPLLLVANAYASAGDGAARTAAFKIRDLSVQLQTASGEDLALCMFSAPLCKGSQAPQGVVRVCEGDLTTLKSQLTSMLRSAS